MTFLIVTAFVWIFVLFKRGPFQSGLPMSYRLPLVTLSFLLLWDGCYSVQLAIWGVLHPSLFYDKFHVESGFFSPAASLSITLFRCAAGVVSYILGFRLALQKPVAYWLGARAAPFLFVATNLHFLLRHQDYGTRRSYLLFAAVNLLTAAFYFWLYRFCVNPRNQELLNKRA